MEMSDTLADWFESCVISEGSQTVQKGLMSRKMFESCVISEGSQTQK